MTTPADTKTPANLRETRKEQAAARKAPAKKAPAKAAAKAAPKPAEKATAKVPAKKAPAQLAATKLRWTIDGPVEAKGKAQSATAGDRSYAITGTGDEWTAVLTVGRKKTVLVDAKSFGTCYNAVVRHNREAAPAVESAA